MISLIFFFVFNLNNKHLGEINVGNTLTKEIKYLYANFYIISTSGYHRAILQPNGDFSLMLY